jgi:hypothetical protein
VTDWKSHLDALVEETQAFSLGPPAKALLPPIAREPSLPPAMHTTGSLREEIAQRVAHFGAHQQRLMRERENYAQAK